MSQKDYSRTSKLDYVKLVEPFPPFLLQQFAKPLA